MTLRRLPSSLASAIRSTNLFMEKYSTLCPMKHACLPTAHAKKDFPHPVLPSMSRFSALSMKVQSISLSSISLFRFLSSEQMTSSITANEQDTSLNPETSGLPSRKHFLMMTREEVAEVITFCKKNDISYKARLAELGIPAWKFYDSKSRYALEQESSEAKGEFLQLYDGGSSVPIGVV